MKALLAFFSLIYIHYTFSMSPATCLQHVSDFWPRHGVLHIEINRKLDSHQRFVSGLSAPNEDFFEFKLPENPMKYDLSEKSPMSEILDDTNYKNYRMYSVLHSLISMFKNGYPDGESYMSPKSLETVEDVKQAGEVPKSSDEGAAEDVLDKLVKEEQREEVEKTSILKELAKSSAGWREEEDQFIVEYSLEYGLLRLSNATRERMNIPVLYVYLNPDTDKCFGDNLSRFILEKFLGYDDMLMASVKPLAEKVDNKGYLRNLVTGEHFRFISTWWVPRGSFVAAFFVMLLFVSISIGFGRWLLIKENRGNCGSFSRRSPFRCC